MNLILKLFAAACFTGAALTGPALAEYPSKPVTLVVTYGAGGAADLAGRLLAKEIPEYLNGDVLVINQAGAGGVTGSMVVANAPKDGYTMLLSRVGAQSAVPALNDTIPYKWDEWTFIGMVELNPLVLAVSTDSPYQTIDDLIQAIKDGERLSYGSAGVGTSLHMAMLVFLDEIGVDPNKLIHVPYKGGGQAATSVVGGNIDMVFNNLSGIIGAIESDQLRPLMVSTPERVEIIPDTPTAAELGYPETSTVIGWSAIYGPVDMDQEAADTWIAALEKLSTDESWLEANEKIGAIPYVLSPEDTKSFVEKQYKAFRKVTEKLDMVIR